MDDQIVQQLELLSELATGCVFGLGFNAGLLTWRIFLESLKGRLLG